MTKAATPNFDALNLTAANSVLAGFVAPLVIVEVAKVGLEFARIIPADGALVTATGLAIGGVVVGALAGHAGQKVESEFSTEPNVQNAEQFVAKQKKAAPLVMTLKSKIQKLKHAGLAFGVVAGSAMEGLSLAQHITHAILSPVTAVASIGLGLVFGAVAFSNTGYRYDAVRNDVNQVRNIISGPTPV